MKIYDCFPFYNELDLLELRLAELYDHVDYFVLVESNTTFTSRPKPYYFEENRSRYAAYLDKIIHVKVTDMPESPDAWINDRFQRDQIRRGFVDAAPSDLILISDLDEIIRPAAVEFMRTQTDYNLFALRMPLCNFRFNYMRSEVEPYVVWGMAARRNVFEHTGVDAFRDMRFRFFNMPYQATVQDNLIVEHAGWHFGYMGDREWLVDKAQSFAHQEINYPEFINNIDVEQSIANRQHWGRFGPERYKIVAMDDYFPKTIQNNLDRYQPWILPDAECRALDILPPYPYNS